MTNSSYTFYTRGVDRITNFDVPFAQTGFGIPFDSADALWTSFQNITTHFVNKTGGSATVGQQDIHRPGWNLVKDQISHQRWFYHLSHHIRR